jgi:hypothetical protein
MAGYTCPVKIQQYRLEDTFGLRYFWIKILLGEIL